MQRNAFELLFTEFLAFRSKFIFHSQNPSLWNIVPEKGGVIELLVFIAKGIAKIASVMAGQKVGGASVDLFEQLQSSGRGNDLPK